VARRRKTNDCQVTDDTLAAITGAIGEAYYGVPSDLKDKALSYLDDNLLAIYKEWSAFFPFKAENIDIKIIKFTV